MSLPKPPKLHIPPNASAESGQSEEVTADLKALRKHLLLPVEEVRSLRWVQDRRLLGILVLGLFPIAALTVFDGAPPVAYWCFGLYFSIVWALFFYHFFTPVGATRTNSMIAFFGTGVISTAILLTATAAGLDKFRADFLTSPNIFIQIGAQILAVSLPAEACKALVIFYFLRSGPSIPSVPTMVFYGLMSGLGFGIYEGTQMSDGPTPADTTTTDPGLVAASAYFHDLLRLTTVSFLNATWTAIGAYFWSLGALYKSRQYGLWAAALGIPTLLHGLHGAFYRTNGWISLAVDFVSVFALMIYLSRSQELERTLQEGGVVPPRMPVAPVSLAGTPPAPQGS